MRGALDAQSSAKEREGKGKRQERGEKPKKEDARSGKLGPREASGQQTKRGKLSRGQSVGIRFQQEVRFGEQQSI